MTRTSSVIIMISFNCKKMLNLNFHPTLLILYEKVFSEEESEEREREGERESEGHHRFKSLTHFVNLI